MKTTLYNMSFLLTGILLFSACAEEKSAESPVNITNKIEVEMGEFIQDSIIEDSIVIVEPVEPVPPPPPAPLPPDPWPDPEPEPWPIDPPLPDPIPDPDYIPEQVNPIVDFPDVEPQFIGGEEAMFKFIKENIKYPKMALEAGIEGKVYVSFVVEKDGTLTNWKLLRGISGGCDEEALRVIRIMPKWKPAEIQGKAVRCRRNLPIKFVAY